MRRILAAALLVVLCVVPIVSQLGFVAYENTTYETIDVLRPVPTPEGPVLATVGDDWVDALPTKTYGTSVLDPPSGAGNADAASTDVTEASYTSTSYTTIDTASMDTFPPTGWTRSSTNWAKVASGGQSGAYGECSSVSGVGGTLTTKNYDLTGKTGTRLTFYWKYTGTNTLENGDFTVTIYTGSSTTKYSNTNNPTSWTQVQLTHATSYSATYWRFNGFLATAGEKFGVDTVTVESYTTSTYYRIEMVWRFDTVDYNSWVLESLYCDFDATSSAETLTFYGGTTSNPSTVIASTKATDFNVDIHATLTGATYYVKIIDDLQATDVDADTWLFDQLYIKLTNTAPLNDAAPICTNLDDTDNLYGRYKLYTFSVSTTDADGYADIHTIDLYCVDAAAATVWQVQYHEDDNTFSEVAGPTYIGLDATSSATRSGINCDVSFILYIELAHPDAADYDLKQIVIDTVAGSDTDSYTSVNYDYETRLDLTVGPTLADGSGTATRGPINGAVTASGTAVYYGSALNPPSTEFDVWVSCSDVATSPWSDLTLSAGTFSTTVYADDAVGQDTYTFIVVAEAAGSAGTNQLHAAHSTTYIADRGFVVLIDTRTTDRVNVYSVAQDQLTLVYEYDSAIISTGTVTIDGNSTTYSGGSGIWYFGQNSSIVQTRTYDNVAMSGDTHGINVVNQNGQSHAQTWDRVRAISLVASPIHAEISADVTFQVIAEYESDNTPFELGTMTLGGDIDMTYYAMGGPGIWQGTHNHSSVSGQTYSSIVLSGADVTIVNMNGKSATVIWDRLKVTGLYANTTTPATGDYVLLNATVVWEYNSTAVTSGTAFMLENLTLTWNGTTSAWETTDHRDYPAAMTYNSMTGTADGIDLWNLDGWSVVVTWNVTATSVTITVVINYGWTVIGYNITLGYSGVYYPNGDPWSGAATFNTTGSTLYPTYDTAGNRTFAVVSITDPLYGLEDFTFNYVWCVWDSVVCSSIGWVWVQNDLESIWMVTTMGVFSWSQNGTDIGSGIKIQVYVNSTTNDYDYTDATSKIGSLWIGTFNSNWYYGHFEGKVEDIAVGGRTFDCEFWDTTKEIPVEHSVHIASMQITEGVDRIWFGLFTIWGNSTATIWDGSTLIKYQETEGYFYINKEFSVNGLHNLTILVNATDGGGHQAQQSMDFSESDYWLWVNYQYNIPIAASIAGESVIRNELGSPNILEVQLYYNVNPLYPIGPGLEVNVTIVAYYVPAGYWGDSDYATMGMWCEWNTYMEWRRSDAFGRVYWAIDSTFAATLCALGPYSYSPYIKVYANDLEVGQYLCLKWWTTIATGSAQADGVHIVVDPAYTILVVNNTRYAYASIIGIPGAYAWTVSATIAGTARSYSGTGDVGNIFLPDVIDTDTNFSATVWQTLESNLIFPVNAFMIEVSAPVSFSLIGSAIDVQDVWVTFGFLTSQATSTFYVWENSTYIGGSYEGFYQVAKPIVIGLHNYTILVNSSQLTIDATHQVKNFALSSLWIWQNFKYTVNPVQLSFDEVSFNQNNESVVITGRVWTSATTLYYTVYEANLGWTTGTISGVSSGSWLSWMWDKSSVTSTSNFTVTVTDNTYNVTFRGFYLRIAGNQWITYGSSVTEDHRTYVQNSSIIYNNPPGFFIDQGTATILAVGGVIIAMFALMVSKQIVKSEILKGIRKGLTQ